MSRFGPTVTPWVDRSPHIGQVIGEEIEKLITERERRRQEENELAQAGAQPLPKDPTVLDRIWPNRPEWMGGTPRSAVPQDAPNPGAPEVQQSMPQTMRGVGIGGAVGPEVPLPQASVSSTLAGEAPKSPEGARRPIATNSISAMIEEEFQPAIYTSRGGRKYSVPNAEGRRMRIQEAGRQATISERLADEERERNEWNRRESVEQENAIELEGVRQGGREALVRERGEANAAIERQRQSGREAIARLRGQITAAGRTGNSSEQVRLINLQMSTIRSQLANLKVPMGTDRMIEETQPGGPERIAAVEQERSQLLTELAELQSEAQILAGKGGAGGGAPQGGAAPAAGTGQRKTLNARMAELKAQGLSFEAATAQLRKEKYIK